LEQKIAQLNNTPSAPPKWIDPTLVVLIPMAGAGSRFAQAGYKFPKPLIETVDGKPMIQLVLENLNIDAKYVFIIQREHDEKYNLQAMLKLLSPKCEIVFVDTLTEGAAATTLLAKSFIDVDCPLLIANSDQFVDGWNSNEFMYAMTNDAIDGGILTFGPVYHSKWSFARLDATGYICEVAEKKPISDTGTVGIYYWRKGSDYVKYAEQMIAANRRINGEFYVCPVYQEAIMDGKKIKPFQIDKMYGLGTPEDLNAFLRAVEMKEVHV
jgi:dTDP-glucose pyrophosphorylase